MGEIHYARVPAKEWRRENLNRQTWDELWNSPEAEKVNQAEVKDHSISFQDC